MTASPVPGAPLEVTFRDVAPTSVQVEWMLPSNDGGTPITSIRVYYRTENQPWGEAQFEEITSLDSSSLMISNLRADTRYQLRVVVKNRIGEADRNRGGDFEADDYFNGIPISASISGLNIASFPGCIGETAWQLPRVQTVYGCYVMVIAIFHYKTLVHVILTIFPALRMGLSCSWKQLFAVRSTTEVK